MAESASSVTSDFSALHDGLARHEIELKLEVPADERAAFEKELNRGSGVQALRLQAIYFDTADERLARHGAVLRLRNEGKRWVQTAKAATGESLRRLEHNVPVAAPRDGGPPAPDLALHASTAVGKALHARTAQSREGTPVLEQLNTAEAAFGIWTLFARHGCCERAPRSGHRRQQ